MGLHVSRQQSQGHVKGKGFGHRFDKHLSCLARKTQGAGHTAHDIESEDFRQDTLLTLAVTEKKDLVKVDDHIELG